MCLTSCCSNRSMYLISPSSLSSSGKSSVTRGEGLRWMQVDSLLTEYASSKKHPPTEFSSGCQKWSLRASKICQTSKAGVTYMTCHFCFCSVRMKTQKRKGSQVEVWRGRTETMRRGKTRRQSEMWIRVCPSSSQSRYQDTFFPSE